MSGLALPPGMALPDISVFGPYTYLVTEVVFGSVALGLLVYAGAVRRAAKTVVALYPIAFVWDWYTLHVGVFAIELRTGVDLLGIPIEEHIFMVVVPALIVGMHETIHGRPGAAANPDDTATLDDAGEGDPSSSPEPVPPSDAEADARGGDP